MRKKIAILSFFKGHSKRGVETWVDGLSNNLIDKFDLKVYQSVLQEDKNYPIFTPKMNLDWSIHENKNSILRRLYFDYWSLKIASFNFKILPNLFRFSPDIVLATDGGWEVAIIRIFTWITGAKMVIVGQAGIGWDEYNNIYSFPDCFVALSAKSKKWAEKHNPLIKVVKIPNAVDIQLFKPIKGRNSKTKRIITIGALEKGKRIDKIILALSKLKNVELIILGEGPEKQFLENLSKKMSVKTEIKNVEHNQVAKYLAKSDLFVSASENYYAFEIVLIEAMASNLAVVANDDSVRREIVADAGILSNPEDSQKFANDIKQALTTRWGNKPRNQSQKFSWEIVSQKYYKLFKRL